jgi:hypothetical protein
MDKINLIDRNFAHSKLGYCSDYQTSKLFHWDRDGSSGNHFVYTDMMLKINERKVGKSIYAWLIEPFEIAPQNYKLIQQINNKYIKVFTHEKTLLDLGQNYELRKNDRDFKMGDKLLLKEYDPKTSKYSGNYVLRSVDYIMYGGKFGLSEGYCIMSWGANVD